MKKKQSELEYWLDEVSKGLAVLHESKVSIGRALKNLRGNKYKKADHLWQQDADKPEDMTTFAQYCKWQWNLSAESINRYIRAYETVEDIKEGNTPQGVSSLDTTEEKIIRPLTSLSKENRQKGWEIAGKMAMEKGEKLSSKHTQRAANKIRNDAEDELARAKEICKPIDQQDKAKLELLQVEDLGIAESRAKAKVTKCLGQLLQDENEKAKLYLTRLLVDRLFEIYPHLMDEPIITG